MALHNRSIATARRWRWLSPTHVVSAIVLSLAAAACGDSPTGVRSPVTPTSGASRDASSAPLTPTQGLLRASPLAQPIVVVKTIPNGGGVIDVPGTDFQLQIPNGAFVGNSMTFTITAYAGSVVAYDFQPHGVVFLKPLTGVQRLPHTNWKSFDLASGTYQFAGAYFADPSQVNFATGQALVNEFMSSTFTVGGATMTWSIPHFSGYLVAAGSGYNVAAGDYNAGY